jgi:hypothetical protein
MSEYVPMPRRGAPASLIVDLLHIGHRIYGAEHLLRLFTKLPAILGKARLASVESSQLKTNLEEFVKHLQKHTKEMLQEDYTPYHPAAVPPTTDSEEGQSEE